MRPEERAAAAGITSVPRSLASAIGPFISGYHLLLLTTFGKVRPPEETAAATR